MPNESSGFRRTDKPETTERNAERKPRFWDSKSPQEQWNRTLPSTQIPQQMYEDMQELAASPNMEYGGKVAPLIRDALEEFLMKYGNPESKTHSQLIQMKEFRDAWADEQMASEMLGNLGTVDQAISRWLSAGDTDQLIRHFDKIIYTMRLLPVEWQEFVCEYFRQSNVLKEAFDYVFGQLGLLDRQREGVEKVHGVIYGG